ncbi:MAG: hypothetical protein LBG91_00735 [Treponema sp.]|jgi:hypothetical protein|nr:hypothetical protein [Treponema sp.]
MRVLIRSAAIVLCFVCCGNNFPSQYTLELPQTPEIWLSLMGEPNWRLEWLNQDGQKQTVDILPGESIGIELPTTWTNPVTAWPYWPGTNIIPGLFKPAGALFPFDVRGERLCLNWKAGPDAVFYRELALANNEPGVRMPANFNWPRFRELFETGVLNEEVRKDPWLVNWRSVAEKTVNSGFDRRRLVPEKRESVNIPVFSGPWYGTSPFAAPLTFQPGKSPAFPAGDVVDVWISKEGILRCNRKSWNFTTWE